METPEDLGTYLGLFNERALEIPADTLSYAPHPAYPLPPDVTDAFVVEPAVPTEECGPPCLEISTV